MDASNRHSSRAMLHRRRPLPDLEQRDPSLITIPLPLQDIPILGPVLSPLIAGPDTTTKTTTTKTSSSSTASNPAPSKPAPSPTTTTNPPSRPTSDTSTSSDTGSTGNSTGTGTRPPTSTADPAPTSSLTSTKPSAGSADPSPTSQDPSGTASAVPSDVPIPPVNAGGNPPSEDPSHSGSIGPIPNSQAFVTSGSSDAPEPGETDSGGTATRGTDTGTTITLAGTGHHPQGTTTGSVSTNSAGPSSPAGPSDAASTHRGLSTGIIVAICIIVLLLFVLFLLCCVRRRNIMKRLRRRKQWFAGAAGKDAEFNDKDDGGLGTKSARSSFATSYDRGQLFVTPVPALNFETAGAPMDQVWPSDLSGSHLSDSIAVPLASHSVSSAPSPTIRNSPDRSSIHSNSSGHGSRPDSVSSESLVAVPQSAVSKESLPSPFFVRPFSPSETWSFPKPPNSNAESRAASVILSASIKSSPFFSAEEQQQHLAAEQENPFADFTEVRPPTASTDTENSAAAHFAPIEVIRRPFVPSMDDEMAVSPGELVRILRRFDDGWVIAEKIGVGPQGLIPIDCLRAPEEDLPAFLAKKRISSYRGRASLLNRASVLSGGSSIGAAL